MATNPDKNDKEEYARNRNNCRRQGLYPLHPLNNSQGKEEKDLLVKFLKEMEQLLIQNKDPRKEETPPGDRIVNDLMRSLITEVEQRSGTFQQKTAESTER